MEFIFDGESANGARVPDGSYTVQVTARDSEGTLLPVETFVRGTVTGVDLTAEPPVLMVGPHRVSLADVREVRALGGEEA
jgi:flagellar basal-body rod modification protein FlgD